MKGKAFELTLYKVLERIYPNAQYQKSLEDYLHVDLSINLRQLYRIVIQGVGAPYILAAKELTSYLAKIRKERNSKLSKILRNRAYSKIEIKKLFSKRERIPDVVVKLGDNKTLIFDMKCYEKSILSARDLYNLAAYRHLIRSIAKTKASAYAVVRYKTKIAKHIDNFLSLNKIKIVPEGYLLEEANITEAWAGIYVRGTVLRETYRGKFEDYFIYIKLDGKIVHVYRGKLHK